MLSLFISPRASADVLYREGGEKERANRIREIRLKRLPTIIIGKLIERFGPAIPGNSHHFVKWGLRLRRMGFVLWIEGIKSPLSVMESQKGHKEGKERSSPA